MSERVTMSFKKYDGYWFPRNYNARHNVYYLKLLKDEFPDQYAWITENIKGPWRVGCERVLDEHGDPIEANGYVKYDGFIEFDNTADAVYYQLRWR